MSTKSRSIRLILLVTFSGCLFGTVLNNFFSAMLSEDTVIGKLFESQTVTIIPENSILDLGILKVGFSFGFDIGVLSVLGILIAWYFLRYFR
ncbi:MAG: hypothetical protein CMG13_07095 [Candidatus Marinimicrobia bacterium]|nr:hypothetical protein [Candidatus Neomarinimicrobiota bacterium]